MPGVHEAVLMFGSLFVRCQPMLSSIRLTQWLIDALRAQSDALPTLRQEKQLPLVTACLVEKSSNYMIVGSNCLPEYGSVAKKYVCCAMNYLECNNREMEHSQFGFAFNAAQDESNAEAEFVSFDTNVIHVAKDDLATFLEALQLYAL